MLIQIAILDIVFSLDSVITAVGMANHLPVMILAIMLAVGVMMFWRNQLVILWIPSNIEDFGFSLLNFSGRKFNCRKFGYSYSERLHLLCYGLLRGGGNAQYQDAKITWSLNHIKRRNNAFSLFNHYRTPLPYKYRVTCSPIW